MTIEEKKEKIDDLQTQMLADLNKLGKLARSIKKRPAKTPKGAISQAVKVASMVIGVAMKHRQIRILETQKPDCHLGGKLSQNEKDINIKK